MKRTIVSAFKPHNQGLTKIFGSLEADIVTLIWDHGEMSARDIFELLRDQGQRLSYGAVKTVLDRLVKKQMLVRSMLGNQYLYQAQLNRAEFSHLASREIIASLVACFGDPVYEQFFDYILQNDPAQFERMCVMFDSLHARKQSA